MDNAKSKNLLGSAGDSFELTPDSLQDNLEDDLPSETDSKKFADDNFDEENSQESISNANEDSDDFEDEYPEDKLVAEITEKDSFDKIQEEIRKLMNPIQASKKLKSEKSKSALSKSDADYNDSEVSGVLKKFNFEKQESKSIVIPHLTSLRFKTYNLYSSLKKLNYSFFKKMNFSKSISFTFFENSHIVISDISGALLMFNYTTNRFDTLTTKIETHGYPTAIEFSVDHSYIYIGHFMGDIKVIDSEAFSEIQSIAKAIMNPISGIKSLTTTEFIAFDAVGNVFSFEMRRNYLLMTNFYSEKIEFFNGCFISSLEVCYMVNSDIQYDKDKNDVIGLVCVDNKSSVSIFQFKPQRKNIEFINIKNDQKLHSAMFNSKKYSISKRIYFSILTSSSILLYELKRTIQRNGSSIYKSMFIQEIDVLDYRCSLSNWINDNTLALLSKNCKEIYLFNFQRISLSDSADATDKDKIGSFDARDKNLIGGNTRTTAMDKDSKFLKDSTVAKSQVKDGFMKQIAQAAQEEPATDLTNVFIERDVLPDTVDFEMVENSMSSKYWIKVQERSFNPSKLNFLDFRGTILEIELRKWRDYFDSEFDLSDIKVVLASFLKVYKGEYSFFNDFVFDQFRRERIMNSYLGDKLKLIFDRKFSIVEENLKSIIEILIAMDNYDFLFYYLRKEFTKRSREDVFEAAIEYFIEHNRIHRMPNQQILELSERLIQSKKAHLITSFILNLDLYNEKIDNLIEFCLANDLYIATIYLYMNIRPPAVSKLLNILLKRAKKIYETSEPNTTATQNDASASNSNETLSIGNILLWFIYKFLNGELFNKKIENWLVEAFLADFYQILSEEKVIVTLFNISWKKALLVYESVLDKKVFDYLKSQMLIDNHKLKEFFDKIEKALTAFDQNIRDFVLFYIKLKVTVQSNTEVTDFKEYFEQFLRFSKFQAFVFPEFLKLLELFVLKYKSSMIEEHLNYFLNQLWENFRMNPTSQTFIRMIIDLHIELEDEKKAFQMIALSPIKIVKAFIFDYIADKIREDNPIIKNQFLADFKYFFIISTSKTFGLLKLFKSSELPVEQLSQQLNNFSTLQLEFYQFLLDYFPDLYRNKQLVMKYFEMIVSKKPEPEIRKFLIEHFESIELVSGLKILLRNHFYYLVAFLFERTGNPEKAFTFYFLELKRLHKAGDSSSEVLNDIIQRLNDLVDKNSNILQNLVIKRNNDNRVEYSQHEVPKYDNDSFGEISIEKTEDLLEKKVISNLNEAIYERESAVIDNNWDDLKKISLRNIMEKEPKNAPRSSKEFPNESILYKSNIVEPKENQSAEIHHRKTSSQKIPTHLKDDLYNIKIKDDNPPLAYSSDISPNIRPNLYYSQRKFDSFQNNNDKLVISSIPPNYSRTDYTFPNANRKINFAQKDSIKKGNTLKDEMNFDRTTDIISINDIIDYCDHNDHHNCNSFKSKCLLSFLNSKNLTDLTGILSSSKNINIDLISNIFREINARAAHFNSILTIINTDYHSERIGSSNGNHFSKRCSICKELFSDNLQDDLLVIAKPKCGHIFHIDCYQRQKASSSSSPQQDRFQDCPVCERIKNLLMNKDSSTANVVFQDPIIRNIVNVVNPLTSVLKTTSYGLKKLMDTVVTFGAFQEEVPVIQESQSRKTDSQKIPSRKESNSFRISTLRRRTSMSKADNQEKDNVNDWMSQFKHDELASRFERIKNDAEFDISLSVNDKKLSR